VPVKRVPPSLDQVRELEVLVKAHHPLLLVQSPEDERVEGLLEHVADRLGLELFGWRPHRGLVPLAPRTGPPIPGTEQPKACLDAIEERGLDALFHLPGFAPSLDGEPALVSQLREMHRTFFTHRGALVLSGDDDAAVLPRSLESLVSVVDLAPPDDQATYRFVSELLRDLRGRTPVEVDMSSEDVAALLSHLRGLTFFEVQKVLTRAVVEDGVLDRSDLAKVLDAKKRIVDRCGVLEYSPAAERLADVAGLDALKAWLRKRRAAFHDPARASEFGLTPPKGLFLVGVQGCGKSLCAKAVAGEWSLPLLRLDPSNLYQRYFGETEKNLRRAIRTAERLAPVVLWIDEIEKAFGQGPEGDSGTSQRVFGTFLHWLAEKKESVFVLATANDVTRLPPELLRKGRFDELFFVDLPRHEVREAIFRIHLRRRGRAPEDFDLARLAERTIGFSGAEIEQVVVSALYTAFGEGREIDTATLVEEAAGTKPLSETMREQVAALREWAADRTVPAG